MGKGGEGGEGGRGRGKEEGEGRKGKEEGDEGRDRGRDKGEWGSTTHYFRLKSCTGECSLVLGVFLSLSHCNPAR